MEQPRELWKPDESFRQQSHLTAYADWLKQRTGITFKDYSDLWTWSVGHPAAFWKSISDFFEVDYDTAPRDIMSADAMPKTKWFEGATLNYAKHIFRKKTDERPAIFFASETVETTSVAWPELEKQTASLQTFLQDLHVGMGDRVAAYLPNIPEATVGLLATISIGAVWSSCSPDFGSESVLDRFRQIAPKVLIAVDGYRYNGRAYDRTGVLKEITRQLPSLQKVIIIPYLDTASREDKIPGSVTWDSVMNVASRPLTFTPVPFSHPIWILYSSGTTGIPKAITHSHGGMLLEHLKYLHFHNDVHAGENFFWYSTTGWMMWNFVQASLLAGATMVLYDGAAAYPGLDRLWKLASTLPIHHFGTSAPFLIACMKAGLHPAESLNLSSLRSIGSTGAPLPPEAFDYVYHHVKKDVWLCSMSGGTDICTAWVGGCPWKPVTEGEIQCRCLGCAMYAFDESGNIVYDKVGEMVVTGSMPCMPVYFWGDDNYERYIESYFNVYPGIWRHGDWVKITGDGGVIILGRSDTTLNRHGVRIGTAEIYRAMDKIPGIKDSLIVNIELPQGGDFMPLFVLMQNDIPLSEELKKDVRERLKRDCSPRHVPDKIIEAPDIPYTISGKKMEAPVKRILMGWNPDEAANRGAMRNPESLSFYIQFLNGPDFGKNSL